MNGLIIVGVCFCVGLGLMLLFKLYKWACSPSALKWIWNHGGILN
jgi:hypothetical protein